MLDISEKNKELVRFNAEGKDPKDIWIEACEDGKTAVEEFHAEFGEPLYCGFASVIIKPASRSLYLPLVKYFKSMGIGGGTGYGGWRISYYDIMGRHKLSFTQSMDLREIGCQRFADVLKKYGVECYMESRAD